MNDQSAQPPSPTRDGLIGDMYMEINNISQGLNIGLFVWALTNNFIASLAETHYSGLALALTSLSISIIFWARYYFDTHILKRSFTVAAVAWYFAYIIAQGISISQIAAPENWLIATGVFLFFGAGFYAFNLLEIRRKAGLEEILLPEGFARWQQQRMVDLAVMAAAALAGAGLVHQNESLALPVALISLAAAIWQLAVTNDYRTRGFIHAGV